MKKQEYSAELGKGEQLKDNHESELWGSAGVHPEDGQVG